MRCISGLLKLLKRVTGQQKPSDHPNGPLNKPPNPYNVPGLDRQMNPQDKGQGVTNQPTSSYPEQLSGDPRMPNEKRDLQKYQEEVRTDFRPFMELPDSAPNNDTQSTDSLNINEQISPKPGGTSDRILNIEDIHKQNHGIAMKMNKLGITTIDRKLYEAAYEEFYKKAAKIAAQRKISISDVMEELL